MELIDNTNDGVANAAGRRSRDNAEGVVEPNSTLSRTTGAPSSGVDAHLRPTQRKRMSRGKATNYAQQGNCRVCGKKSMNTCSRCKDDAKIGAAEPWLCHTKNGSLCFPTHMSEVHGI